MGRQIDSILSFSYPFVGYFSTQSFTPKSLELHNDFIERDLSMRNDSILIGEHVNAHIDERN